jgi:hypothetical protein
MQIHRLRRPSGELVSKIKDEIEASGLPATVSIQKNIKRSWGSITIKPTKKAKLNEHAGFWTEVQATRAIEIARACGLFVQPYEYESVSYQQGLWYLMEEIKQ